MIGQTLKKLGCCGTLVWLALAAVMVVFFVGEYLERPPEKQSIYKAGVQVRNINRFYWFNLYSSPRKVFCVHESKYQ